MKWPWLHHVTASLVLTSENDGGCNPRLNQLIADALPTSKLEILPDYKHSLLMAGMSGTSYPQFIRRLGDGLLLGVDGFG